MRLTPARQRNAVSEGFALGLLMCGRDRIPSGPMTSLFFQSSWRNWTHRTTFSQVDHDLKMGKNGHLVFTRADEGKSTFNFYWTRDRELRLHMRSQWQHGDQDPSASEIAASIDGGLPAEAWKALAEDFLRRLDRDGE